ncbi:2OG-Fe(II) oxygenase [Membranihabitans marinus]|uniref:2OG-Fe(II) oxygenase n=1 Tax=Membranihabitans marinus TaxID=1227546 RepID=UPI001F16D955|nr:2OG-Fe(II) oxygenase [Membranihabitans marinus]
MMNESIIHSDYGDLNHHLAKWSEQYQNNYPFPNIYVDDFFDPRYLKKVLEEFPDIDALQQKVQYNNPNELKQGTKGESQFGPYTKNLVHYLNSEPFLVFLQSMTGIKETLIPDPYFEGGGFHEIKPGGFLKLHVDFHKHRRMQLCRRLNLLIYLNEDWEEDFGGHFELWEKDMSKCALRILPKFNRIALFSTNGDSWHGHPNPLKCPEGRSRKSLALYYYTSSRPENELSSAQANKITTTFVARKGEDSKKMRMYNKLVESVTEILPDKLLYFIKGRRNK